MPYCTELVKFESISFSEKKTPSFFKRSSAWKRRQETIIVLWVGPQMVLDDATGADVRWCWSMDFYGSCLSSVCPRLVFGKHQTTSPRQSRHVGDWWLCVNQGLHFWFGIWETPFYLTFEFSDLDRNIQKLDRKLHIGLDRERKKKPRESSSVQPWMAMAFFSFSAL